MPAIPADLRGDLRIEDIKTTIVDVPMVRKHKLSSLSVTAQSYVIVEVRLANGIIGIGEAATLGGPRWSEESVESIKATIDTYLTPALTGAAAERFEAARIRMDGAAKRNNAATCGSRISRSTFPLARGLGSYRQPEGLTGMRAGLASRLRAKSIRYQRSA